MSFSFLSFLFEGNYENENEKETRENSDLVSLRATLIIRSPLGVQCKMWKFKH
jgi:hypothetical protein